MGIIYTPCYCGCHGNVTHLRTHTTPHMHTHTYLKQEKKCLESRLYDFKW